MSIESESNNVRPAQINQLTGSPQVRFASTNEEIEPLSNPLELEPSTSERSPADEKKFKELSRNLQNAQLQGRRMSQFAFEPVSTPVSRVRRRIDIIYPKYLGGTCAVESDI